MAERRACDLLIVGGGPTGTTLAVLLAQRGVRVLVAEKDAGIYPLPRAAHLDHETIRILQEAGVAEASARRSPRPRGRAKCAQPGATRGRNRVRRPWLRGAVAGGGHHRP